MTIFIDDQQFIALGNGIYQEVKTGRKYRVKIVAIDNGYSFPSEADINNENSVILSRFSFAVWGYKLPSAFLDALKKLKYSSFQQKLKKLLDEPSIKLFNNRIDDLLRGEAKVKEYHIIKKRRK